MNKQDIFNKAVLGIIKQGGYGYDGDNGCRYLTDDGNRCAIGQLAKSENQAQKWQDFDFAVDYIADELNITDKEIIKFMGEMQAEHDALAVIEAPMSEFKQIFSLLGKKHGLDVSVCNTP